MSTAQIFLLAISLTFALGQLVTMATAKNSKPIDALNFGRAIILPAVGAGFALLRTKAQVIQNVALIKDDVIVSGGTTMTKRDVSHFGSRLLIDDFYVLAIVVILVGLILYEIKVGNGQREKSPVRFWGWVRYGIAGFFVPDFLAVTALYLVYVRS